MQSIVTILPIGKGREFGNDYRPFVPGFQQFDFPLHRPSLT
jgi:hypothetical protein